MDPLHLLTRSSKRPHVSRNKNESLPSRGSETNPQLFGLKNGVNAVPTPSRKRKRGSVVDTSAGGESAVPNFFGGAVVEDAKPSEAQTSEDEEDTAIEQSLISDVAGQEHGVEELAMGEEERKSILKSHKLKVTLIRGTAEVDKPKKKNKKKELVGQKKNVQVSLYPQPVSNFDALRQRYGISKSMMRNIEEQGYRTPTEVQLGSLPMLLGNLEQLLPDEDFARQDTGSEAQAPGQLDLLTVAPTGSGKTLAFLIPLVHKLAQGRHTDKEASVKAVILAPTKELANQIANEGRKLAANTGVTITSVRKGMVIGQTNLVDDESFIETPNPPVKSDILVSTPMTFVNSMADSAKTEVGLASIRYLVLDEADVLLDPLFREQTLSVWNALTNPSLRISLWSATMGSNIEEFAKKAIDTRVTALTESTGKTPSQAPLVRLVVGLKDSAVPNIDHQMTYAATEQGKLLALRQLLHPSTTDNSGRTPLRAPFLVFTQTIERAVALHSELLYDIPSEAGGISRIAVLHSDLSDTARDKVMTRFRKGEVWVLITTDLLSRGVDFRGINGVVNYDVPNSSAAYVHRVGRTGRAGRKGGVAVTLYTKEDIPYIKNVANVIAASEKQKGSNGKGVEQWLLDALPNVSKRDKQQLKKHGVEARRSSKMDKGRKGAAKMRISTKSGFERRLENNRRSAAAARLETSRT